jgi:hypothetical protein
MLQRALSKCATASRAIEPELVWLQLVPIFNLVWQFFVVKGIAKSLRNEFARRAIPTTEELPAQPIGLAMCVSACCCIVPLLGLLASVAFLILWIKYWVKVTEYSKLLDEAQVVVH